MSEQDTSFDPETGARDMIDLGGDRPSAPESPVAPDPKAMSDEDIRLANMTAKIVEALKTVYDPEIPVDIYELGLIYQVDLEPDHSLKVEMTLTAPGCPVAGEMPGWVRDACETVKGVERADVTLTFDPPWTPDRMSDEAKLTLNMF